MTTTLDANRACLNCGCAFGTPRPNYCPDCGQESNPRPPTLGEFAQQFGGSIMAAEGALWRTLVLLFTRPGELTREYLAGRRRRYVLPLRLYLTVSLVALLAINLSGAMKVEHASGPAVVSEDVNLDLDFGRWRFGMRRGVFFCDNLPDWICARLQRRLDLDPKNFRRDFEDASQRFVSHWGSAMFALVPLFALWVKLAWLNRRMRYTEHLVFALHLHAFWFGALMLVQVVPGALAAVPILWMPVYALLATRRVYGGRWWVLIGRNLAVALVYGFSMLLALGVVTLWTLVG
ncbi:MAG TPA: DUF3667 domain-containing protein [Burkholderiaceae bacterium]|nr:DUF3667 domain-containing protein [Burkholderiaceae bacterium]